MGDTEARPTVLISYAHEDEGLKDQLIAQLAVLEREDLIELWDDRQIDAGADWYPELEAAMARAAVALCIISPDYLTSDFITNEEIPYLLGRRERDGLLLLGVVMRPCPWDRVRWLEPIQMPLDPATPLSALRRPQREQALADLAGLISRKLEDPTFALATPPSAWPPLAEHLVHIERLPQTGTDLFGRDRELTLLDEAWQAEKTHIVSFVAWGGVGKSALVNKWIEQLAQDNYRGAERVYAWSFYSQGSGERVASSDLFVNDALRWFGDVEMADSARSPWDKGQRLAELVQEQPTLLILDGLEPLQSWYEHDRGEVNDPAIAGLIRQLARRNTGLCVITTREEVKRLETYPDWTVQGDLERISAEAGRALLRVGGIRGTDAELEQVTRDFGNHALAIDLLVAYLQEMPGRQAVHARLIPDLDIPDEEGRHPRRVIEAVAERFGDSPELNVLHIMGLFDRPATAEELNWLRVRPAIPRLTDHIHGVSGHDWNGVAERLRGTRLIARESHHNLSGLDTHPLVREHFSDRLRAADQEAWRAGHSQLYDFLSMSAPRFPDTLAEMRLLFWAVSHGCRAGRWEQALHDAYLPRLMRGERFFAVHDLPAPGEALAALFSFFDSPWTRVLGALRRSDQGYVLNAAGLALSSLGRASTATQALRAALSLAVADELWENAAIAAGNLSVLYIVIGDIPSALQCAQQSVGFGEGATRRRAADNHRAFLGDVLHHAGRTAEAAKAFSDAEASQTARHPSVPYLYSGPGHLYCDLLLSQGHHRRVALRGAQTLSWVRRDPHVVPLTLGKEYLTLARSHMLSALDEQTGDFQKASECFEQALGALRRTQRVDEVCRGLVMRTEFSRVQGDFAGAVRDLDEAYEIAMRGGMRLYECDVHLECCRMLLAIVDARAPLDPNDVFPDSPLALYSAVEQPLPAARRHLDNAEAMVNEMGYHRRDPEVLLERARLQLLEGDRDAAAETLDAAKARIDEMGCHRWDHDVERLRQRL